METTKIALFNGREIRKILHNSEWWFSVADVCGALTDSVDAGAYWRKLKQRLTEEGSEVVTFCHGLKLEASDGKKYEIDCANTEGIFRIIQSIPSPKAEPFKRWLAKVGYERVQEIEDPELATKRTRALYKAKGYPDAWIEKRMRGIAVREQLTGEWQKRGVKEGQEYAILTAEISKAAFGLTPSEYKKKKGLKRENLRDHMRLPSIKMRRVLCRIKTQRRKVGKFPEMHGRNWSWRAGSLLYLMRITSICLRSRLLCSLSNGISFIAQNLVL
jgi:hypothetical protein